MKAVYRNQVCRYRRWIADDIDDTKGSIFAEVGGENLHTKQNDRLLPGGGDILIWTKVFLETSEILHFISFYLFFFPPPSAPCYFKPASCKLRALKALSVRAVQMAERLDLRSEVRLSPLVAV